MSNSDLRVSDRDAPPTARRLTRDVLALVLTTLAVLLAGLILFSPPAGRDGLPTGDEMEGPPPLQPADPPPDAQDPRTDAGEGPAGLHYTEAELAVWQERAARGPYRSAGDAGTNTPGDWERIESNARAFMKSPAQSRWSGPDGDGCVQPGDDEPPTEEPSQLRDAAFTSLVLDDPVRREAVRTALLAQAREPNLDFSDASKWCPDILYDVVPSFSMSHWLTKLLFAYDYLGDSGWAATDRAVIDAWFRDAAEFMAGDIDSSLEENFADRSSGDLSPSDARTDAPGCSREPYFGGPTICSTARHYNNRRAAQARFVGLVGIQQDDEALRETAARFVREFVQFSVYPEGFVGDFERWTDDLPDLGWAYGVNATAATLTIADHFARAGDDSLYRFSTEQGAFGTEGAPRDLRFAATALVRYLGGSLDRYATTDPSGVGDPDKLIDGVHEPSTWRSSHDIALAPSNLYFRDPVIRASYTRTGEGMPDHAPSPAVNGPHEVWTGEGGIYPGVLFMFGQLEDQVWPYPASQGGVAASQPSEERSPPAGESSPAMPTAAAPVDEDLAVRVSWTEDLADHVPLDGRELSGVVYVFLDMSALEAEARQVRQVRWYLDDRLHHTEDDHPYYLEGGHTSTVRANPFRTGSLEVGRHSLAAEVTDATGTWRSQEVEFTVVRRP